MFEVDSVQWNRGALPYCPFTSFFAQGDPPIDFIKVEFYDNGRNSRALIG